MLVPLAPAVGSAHRHGDRATREGTVQKLRSFCTGACATVSEGTRRVKTPCENADIPHGGFCTMARRFGYSRVSTSDQDWSLQLEALTKAGVDDRDIFRETASGANGYRK